MVAEMSASHPDGTERAVARVTAWLLATSDTADAATDRYPPLVEGEAVPVPHSWEGAKGYLETVSWRRQGRRQYGKRGLAQSACAAGGFGGDDGSAAPRDGGRFANGVGAALDPDQFVFMNTDTVVHLHRLPVGNDFALRARGSIGPDGVGVTTAEIFDRHGFIGTGAQTLFVQRAYE